MCHVISRAIPLDCKPTVKCDDMVPTEVTQIDLLKLVSQQSIVTSCEPPFMNGHHKCSHHPAYGLIAHVVANTYVTSADYWLTASVQYFCD